MQDVDLENLISSLNDGMCAAVIGPGFSLIGDKNTDLGKEDGLYQMIYTQPNMQETQYSLPDGFFYTNRTNQAEDIKMKNFILSQIKKFYAAKPPPAHYELLMAIPFKLVISLSPDDYLSRALAAKNIRHSFVYYKSGSGLYKRNFDHDSGALKYAAITADEPLTQNGEMLILNLMGVYDDTQSLVATFDHFLEFMYNISPVDKKLVGHLHTVIQQASTFLFLGFGYGPWYLKIIFFILQKLIGHNKEKKAIINADDTADDNIKFYQNQFDLLFFKESTLQFLDTIKNLCNPPIPLPNTNGNLPVVKKCIIRMFSANPRGTQPMRLDAEYKNIEYKYQKPLVQISTDLKRIPAASKKEFWDTINQDFPTVIIISAHGYGQFDKDNANTVSFEKDSEDDRLRHDALMEIISNLMANPQNQLTCILLACCHSSLLAKELHEKTGVPFCIGCKGAINDDGISIFVNGFLDYVFNARTEVDYAKAFNTGIAAISPVNNEAILECRLAIKLYGDK